MSILIKNIGFCFCFIREKIRKYKSKNELTQFKFIFKYQNYIILFNIIF